MGVYKGCCLVLVVGSWLFVVCGLWLVVGARFSVIGFQAQSGKGHTIRKMQKIKKHARTQKNKKKKR